MSTSNVGGEYGDVRAVIDIPSLNAYLAEKASAIKPPVAVKQFKVTSILPASDQYSMVSVWSGIAPSHRYVHPVVTVFV